MKKSKYLQRVDRKIAKMVLSVAGIAILTAILTFLLYFQVRTIEIKGNAYLSDEQVKELVLQGPFASNTYVLSHRDYSERTADVPFLKGITVDQISHDTICIHVAEKQLEGYVKYLDGFFYFDKNGVIQESTTQALDGIPCIEGLRFDNVRVGDKLPVGNELVFQSIVGVTRMITKNGLDPDRIVLDEAYSITLYFDGIIVKLGKDSEMEEKVTHLAAILPELEGLDGVLHLEGVTPETNTITFEKSIEMGEIVADVPGEDSSDDNSLQEDDTETDVLEDAQDELE